MQRWEVDVEGIYSSSSDTLSTLKGKLILDQTHYVNNDIFILGIEVKVIFVPKSLQSI